MAIMKKYALERDYVQVPNETAKAVEEKTVEKSISLEALGLIVNLWSYNIETWEVHKTELYKRFTFNKERSVKKAWNELMDAGYIVEFKFRQGKKWEYVYVYRIQPFSEVEIEKILADGREEYGEIWGLQNAVPNENFGDCILKSSKCGLQNVELSNEKGKKEKSKKNKKSFVNKETDIPLENNVPIGDQLVNIANEFYGEFASGRWSKNEWGALIYKLVGEILSSEVKITDHQKYIHGALTRIARHHDLNNGKVKGEGGLFAFQKWLEE